ncbi:hypothetical protein GCM10011400_64020 [Paraburkholderia caffeinilytica]|uniref:DDE domain-containing protein n=1 Tax=Paraburkholderia caffeinilytica TaxID=1761016 RepID=A0ABQ1NB94_9BURK|nr:hypothetical protein GCM10011400_64020 [Paraburkholderia caffeinilytica]
MKAKTKSPAQDAACWHGKVLKQVHYPLDVILLCAHRDKAAARRYFEKAIEQNGEPETIAVDKSGANLAELEALNTERLTPIKVRQNKYLSNAVE